MAPKVLPLPKRGGSLLGYRGNCDRNGLLTPVYGRAILSGETDKICKLSVIEYNLMSQLTNAVGKRR